MYSTSYNTVYCIGIAKCRVRGEIHGSLLKGSLTPVLPESTALEGPMQTFCFLAENSAVHWHQCCQNLQPFRPNENVLFLAYNSTVQWHHCCQNLQPLRPNDNVLFTGREFCSSLTPVLPESTPFRPNENILFLTYNYAVQWHQCCQNLQPVTTENVLSPDRH